MQCHEDLQVLNRVSCMVRMWEDGPMYVDWHVHSVLKAAPFLLTKFTNNNMGNSFFGRCSSMKANSVVNVGNNCSCTFKKTHINFFFL
jgi:hypothetical protein